MALNPPDPVLGQLYDVIVVGGGPAGLNAALILGRCRRRVLLCDAGTPRNAVSRGVRGFLTRDGEPPFEMRRIGREQLAPYANVTIREAEAVKTRCLPVGFEVTFANGETATARKLLLATGLLDDMPSVPGFEDLYGRGVYNCPYCDGWEHRDEPIAAYGQGERGKEFGLGLTVWSRDVVLLTDGPAELSAEDRAQLDRHGVRVMEEPLSRLEGDAEGLKRVVFANGSSFETKALFFIHGQKEGSELIAGVGCEMNDKGTVETRDYEKTNVPGAFVAGDASHRVQFAIVAAAEGAMAAFAINTELLKEDLEDAADPADLAAN